MFSLIRHQLTLIICSLIILTLVAVLTISYFLVSADYEQKIHANNAAMAESLATNIAQFVGNAYAVSELVAAYPDVLSLPPAKQREILVDTTRRFPFFQLLIFHELNGDQTARTSGELANRANRWWFKQFMAEKRPFISKTYYSVASESPITTVLHGIYTNGDLRGLLMSDIETGTLQQMVEEFSSGEGNYAYLLDGEGVVIAHPDRKQVAELYNYHTLKKSALLRDDSGRMIKDAKGNEITFEVDIQVDPALRAIIANVRAGETGVGEYKESDGETNICAYRSIPLPGNSDPWSLIVVQKKSVALAFMEVVTAKIALVGLVVLVFAGFLTYWFAKRVTNPLVDIVNATNQLKDGNLAVQLHEPSNNEIGVLAMNFNQMVTELRQHRESLEKLAFRDALTGLPNRAYLNSLLEEELTKARGGQSSGIILFIDMDDLKLINDNFGHTFGDKVIVEAGRHIVEAVGEQALVARIGGDEFVVVLSGKISRSDAIAITQRVVANLCREYEVSVERLQMSASIGVVIYPEDGDRAEDVLKKADSAMYAAKQAGRNCWRFYEAYMLHDTYEKMMLTNGLRRALEREELFLHYQPQFTITGDKIVGFEALLRWNSAEFGIVPPDRFIPLAEQSGLILPIGQWVMQEACRFARRLADLGKADVRIAVNISARQMISEDFVAMVCASIEKAGIKPEQLEIEITESVLIESMEDSVAKLEQLRDMGVQISLDDFGTGYSSLTYLMSLPVRSLKIDKSFMAKMANEKEQMQLVSSIVSLGRSLQLLTVAEGVETASQLALLTQMGCDRIQGYIFSQPISDEAAIRLILPESNADSGAHSEA